MAKQAKVWTGSAWADLASATTDLTPYSTTAQMNTAIGASAGLTLITSTTFTNQSTIVFDNCFTSTYTNYLIKINLTAVSANSYLFHYYRSSVPADITANYISTYNTFYAGSSISGSASDTLFIPALQSANPYFTTTLFVDGPTSTTAKYMSANIGMNTSSAGGQLVSGTGHSRNTNATAAAGIKFYTSTGTISGTIRIYGMKD